MCSFRTRNFFGLSAEDCRLDCCLGKLESVILAEVNSSPLSCDSCLKWLSFVSVFPILGNLILTKSTTTCTIVSTKLLVYGQDCWWTSYFCYFGSVESVVETLPANLLPPEPGSGALTLDLFRN